MAVRFGKVKLPNPVTGSQPYFYSIITEKENDEKE